MIVKRVRATAKRGRRIEAVQLIKEAGMFSRISMTVEGNKDVIVIDFEYTDMADYAAKVYDDEPPAGWYEVTTAVESEILRVVY